ncbi:YdcH family protein [Falsiroseomonas oryzae]|uniref:YdcH family protein n=1 Tax=Falsiroseomonas oryzae TaxID=2766473 RepID=UPI0022EA6D96|nr:YdcH family protein [Roseomonas sp. MO-31]
MPELPRLRALEERHAALEARIAEEDNRPRPDPDQLNRMKREKLRLKEEMERLKAPRLH